MLRSTACFRQSVHSATCLYRYVTPGNRVDFRQRISDPYAFALRLEGVCIDVDWDEKVQVLPAFGRNPVHRGFSASMLIPAGSVHQTITNAPANPVDFNKTFGGLSVGGFDPQSEHSPFVIERNPDSANCIVWRSAGQGANKAIRRKHCYVSFDPLPPGYAVVWDRFPGHGLLVNTDPVPVTDVIELGYNSLFAMSELQSQMTWTYSCTVLMMTPDEYSDMKAGNLAPPGPQFTDDRFAMIYCFLSEYAAIADLDPDADDANWCAESLSRRPNADFDNATNYFAVDMIAAMAQQLLNFTAWTVYDDEFEKAESLARQLFQQIVELPPDRFYPRPRYPSISLPSVPM